jgi:hypothetical protein
MTKPASFDAYKPPEEHFAAYADGELRGEDLIRMEEWLCAHPEDAARVDAQQQPSSLCRRTTPPEPSETVWAAALERIESALASSSVLPKGQPNRLKVSTRIKVGALAAAAAVAAAFVLYSGGLGDRATHREQLLDSPAAKVQAIGGPETNSIDDDLAFLQNPALSLLILSPDDVDILSLEGADDDAIVVGEPPVGKEFKLVSPGDIALRSVAADVDGMVPQMRVKPGAAAVPMLVAPMNVSKNER